jgi:hypothetical protein
MVADSPYVLPLPGTGRRPLQIDLYAQRYAGDQLTTIIIVEVKCFSSTSSVWDDLYSAIGQYVVYRNLLRRRGVSDTLYLAVPSHAYAGIISQVALPIMDEIQVRMIVVDIDREVIERWYP